MSSNKKNEFRVSQGNRSTGDYVPQNGKIMWPVKEGVSKEGAMRSKVHCTQFAVGAKYLGDRTSCHTGSHRLDFVVINEPHTAVSEPFNFRIVSDNPVVMHDNKVLFVLPPFVIEK